MQLSNTFQALASLKGNFVASLNNSTNNWY